MIGRFVACAMAAAGLAGALPGAAFAQGAEKITFVTDFGFNGRHAYYFVAQEKGYYKDANLEVQIVRGQGSADAVKQVAAGTAQIGFADAAAVILGRGNDGVAVKMVAVVYAKPPHAIYVLKDSGIKTPKDLEGRSIADTAFSAMPRLFDAYAKAAKIDASKVKWVVAAGDALPGMLSLGRADGIGQFTVGEPLLRKAAAPKEIVALSYGDVGLDYYSNGIIATDAMIASKPDTIRRFVSATLRGLEVAMKDPKAAGQIMHKFHRQVDVDIGAGETEMVKGLAGQTGLPLGTVDSARMQRTVDIVSGAFKLKTPVKASDVLATGFVPAK